MLIAFTLSMPSAASWNGKWSGEGRLYCVVRSLKDADAERVTSNRSYYYRWSDGWAAAVAVKMVTPSEAASLRSRSKGFCGYEWMIDTIISHGRILADHEIPAIETAVTT